MLDNIPNKDIDIIIEGDFNIDLNKAQPIWTNLISSFGLSQLIQSFTRITQKTKTIIDHIYIPIKQIKLKI